MDEQEWLAERFEGARAHLRAVAYRMLGSASDADDAVQETWIRLSRTDTSGVDNLTGWLTTVVARVCLDILRSRRSRRVESVGEHPPELASNGDAGTDPEHEAMLADSVGLALLVVLETLAPAERVAFVLHDMFAVPFDEIAPIVGRSSTATRQLASRARSRVQGGNAASDVDVVHHREVVDAFLAAARRGDLQALLAALDPDVVLRSDAAAVRVGSAPEIRGAHDVAEQFSGRAVLARTALVDGAVGVVVAPAGRLMLALRLTFRQGRIAEIDVVADGDRLAELELAVLDR